MTADETRRLTLPLTDASVRALHAGDEVLLTGTLITGRDRACARLHGQLAAGEPLPVDLADELLYFVGPAPAPPGMAIGSAGPTTSARMNPFMPALLGAGLRGMIGKGFIGEEVKRAIERRPGVYFGAVGGTGALLAQTIASAEVVAFAEFRSEAVFRLELEAFPAVVLHDCHGNDLYEETYGSVVADVATGEAGVGRRG